MDIHSMVTAIVYDENDELKVARTVCNIDFLAYAYSLKESIGNSVLKQTLYNSGIDECQSVSINLPEKPTDNVIINIENEEDETDGENKRAIISNAVNEINKVLDILDDTIFSDIIDPKKDLNGKGSVIFSSRIFK